VKSEALRMERKSRNLLENPIKVGVVSQANLRPDGNFMSAGPARRVIFTTAQTGSDKINVLSNLGAEVYVLGEKRVNLEEALETLHTLGVRRLMVEGGGTLNFELLRLGLVDELYVYVAPKIFGGQAAPTMAAGPGLGEPAGLQLKFLDATALDDGGGLLIRYSL
jgi:2,5-diamino-6-(ribosylamino)-4(3H)-pyrimidinone 5'-phosphate reductase